MKCHNRIDKTKIAGHSQGFPDSNFTQTTLPDTLPEITFSFS